MPDTASPSTNPGNAEPAAARRPILVGYDGSPDAVAALDWAIAEARMAHLPLVVAYVRHDFSSREGAEATMAWAPSVVAALAPPGAPIVAEGADRASAAGVATSTVLLEGPTAPALAERTNEASMLVVGSRGIGAIQGALLGSVVPHVVSHSHCPVIVVRAQSNPEGPVVAGVDGSPESLDTLGWAFEYAHRHARPLQVRYAYDVPVYPEVVPYVPPVEVVDQIAEEADRAVRDEVARWSARYPDVQVSALAVQDRPARVLAEASKTAGLVVVGSHGRGGFTGMLLGATSQALLHHAHCTVAVIRHERH